MNEVEKYFSKKRQPTYWIAFLNEAWTFAQAIVLDIDHVPVSRFAVKNSQAPIDMRGDDARTVRLWKKTGNFVVYG